MILFKSFPSKQKLLPVLITIKTTISCGFFYFRDGRGKSGVAAFEPHRFLNGTTIRADIKSGI